jgi:multidrug efflux pump subunit AcrB
MTSLFYRQKRLFALAVLMILAVGSVALTTIARQEDPTITNLFATIVTPVPGAGPERVESLVTEKIEEELEEIAEIKEIASVSRTGISVITVELSELVPDDQLEPVWSEIRDALADAAARFPDGVPDPTFDNDRTGAYTAIAALVPREGTDTPLAIVGRYAERLQDRLRGLSGTDLVRLYGEPVEEVLVEIDPDRLALLGLRPVQVADAIAGADAKVEAGRVRGADTDYLIELAGEIEAVDRIRRIPIAAGDGEAGAGAPLVRVGDVAEVRRALLDPPETLAYADGERAVIIAARMEADLQVDAWMGRVRAAMADFEATLPAGLELRLLFDQSSYTADRLTGLAGNLAIGVSLVVGVLLVTLGWRAALVVAVMLPLTSLLSLAVLQKLGVPIQQMSVTGLIVALGLLVDAAIVMTDEIRKRLRGEEPVLAVSGAVKRLAVPLGASTITTVLAFVPMALLPGPAGDFVGSIAIAVIVMLLASLLLALTLTPALAGFLLPRDRVADARGGLGGLLRHGISPGAAGRLFAASIALSLRRPRLAVLAAVALPLVGFGAFPTLTAQFFPGVERDQFYIQLTLPDGTPIAETAEAARAAEAVLRDDPGVDRVHWVVGESAPPFYYNMMEDRDGVPGFAEALVTARSAEAAAAAVPRLQAALDRALPGAQVVVRDLTQGPPVAAPVELRLVGPNLETLRAFGDEARARVATVPGVTHTRATLLGGPPKLVFELDEDTVRLAGLDLAEVARQLETLLEGVTGGSLLEATEELPIRVRLPQGDRAAADRIASLAIMPPGAQALAAAGTYPGIPLRALGEVRLAPSESPIARRNGERINTIQAYLEPGVLPEEALQVVQANLADRPLGLPPGYRIEWGGDADARAETVRNLMAPIGLIVALLIATVVATFNSYRLSLIAGAVSVLSIGLSLLALAVFGYPFGIQALIGVIGSIGVSINAAIIILTAMQRDDEAMRGEPEAMTGVVTGAARHIVSTTVTTFGGFLPLILAGGGFWPPFAMAIAGGVLLSTVVSFYFVPPMFRLLQGRGRRPAEAGAIAQGEDPARSPTHRQAAPPQTDALPEPAAA